LSSDGKSTRGDLLKASISSVVFGLLGVALGGIFILLDVNGTRPIGIFIVLGVPFTGFAALAVLRVRRSADH
jgi:hypothetical protein